MSGNRLLIGLLLGGVFSAATGVAESSAWQDDGAGFESVTDPARALFELPEPWAVPASGGGDPEERLSEVVTLRHDVPLGDGETLRVHELLTLRSWLSEEKRAVLFLNTTAVAANLWTIPAEGYNGPQMAARRGMFAFTVDYIGVGDNARPGMDGRESTFERNLDALRHIIRYIRYFRGVPRVDLVGESWGGAHATRLAADPARVRSCVMASMTYKAVANPAFTAPEFKAFLGSLPGNYIPADPKLIEAMAAEAPEEVRTYIREAQTGPRLTTQLWQIQGGLPHFDPGVARVPGLVIASTAESADGRALADDYGAGGADFFEIAGSAHAPRLTSPANAEAFWTRVFEFLEAPPVSGEASEVWKVDFFVPYAEGKEIFVTEYLTPRSLTRQPPRAAVFLPAAEYLGATWDLPGHRRSAPVMAAERGFYAYTVDYLGMGKSFRPEDGSEVDFRANAEAVRAVIDHVRRSHGVLGVDVVGEGHGGEVAAVLAADSERVRSVVLATIFYKDLKPRFADQFMTAEYEAFLRRQEDGYFVPNFVPRTLRWTEDPAIQDFFLATQQDLEVPTGHFLQYLGDGLPVIDAAAARVPMLILIPELNRFAAVEDLSNLAADWGSDATLVVLEGGHHVPRIETPEVAAEFFRQLFDFLDP